MPTLPNAVREKLASEFRFAATNVAKAENIEAKLYFFSVFYGETGRQLNIHWDSDLALLFLVTQSVGSVISQRPKLAAGVPNSISEKFLHALDDVSNEIASSFEHDEVDVPRLYAALARTAELAYMTTGNGNYLTYKGLITI